MEQSQAAQAIPAEATLVQPTASSRRASPAKMSRAAWSIYNCLPGREPAHLDPAEPRPGQGVPQIQELSQYFSVSTTEGRQPCCRGR